ncbi:MAG: GHMP kinase [Clostridiales bacterium]|nr:GHMP kinase [Clostridiales bacterium]
MKCIEVFENKYGREPDAMSFCPYRICPLGAHVDHQLGKINGFAIDKGIHIAYGAKRNGIIEMRSVNFPKRAQFHVRDIPDSRVGDWADYLRGAALLLAEKYPLRTGLCGVIEGTLPIGGLSSSAAVTIAFMAALCKVNNITLEPMELILTAKAVENNYVGVSSGKLDQSCEVLCKKDHLLYLDTKDDSYELIPSSPNMKPYKIAVFFSGLEHSLVSSKYNLRVDECKAAAYGLMAFSGMDYGKFETVRLRDVPKAVFNQYGNKLPEVWRKRAENFFSETERAERGAEAWRKGNIEDYGKLITQSGYSSINSYESGSEELKGLYEIITKQDGVYGGRFSGAGFKGCCMALIDPSFAESIEKNVAEEYKKRFPKLADKYSFYLCESADGVKF